MKNPRQTIKDILGDLLLFLKDNRIETFKYLMFHKKV